MKHKDFVLQTQFHDMFFLVMDIKALGKLRVIDLKNELDKRGLSKAGTKSVLIERLKEVIGILFPKLVVLLSAQILKIRGHHDKNFS